MHSSIFEECDHTIIFGICIQEENCPGQEADNYTVHILTAPTQSYLCTHTDLRTMSSMEEVVLNFTTDFLEHNHHYLALVEAQNHIGGRNSSEIHLSKLYTMHHI